jgi:hypothetical protein
MKFIAAVADDGAASVVRQLPTLRAFVDVEPVVAVSDPALVTYVLVFVIRPVGPNHLRRFMCHTVSLSGKKLCLIRHRRSLEGVGQGVEVC